VFLETEASGKMKIKRLEEATTMVEAVDTPPPSGSPAKVLPKLKPPDLPELPPKLPDNGPFVVSLLRPPVHSSESSTAIKLVDEGKQDPEEVRAKLTIGELNIFVNLLVGQNKSLPSILHNNNSLHVSSSGQHTFPLLSDESPKGHPLSPIVYVYHANKLKSEPSTTIECELGHFLNPMGQIQDNSCLRLKEVAIWAEIELLGFNSNWAIMEDGNNYLFSCLSVPRKNVFSFREQLLCRTNAEETSLLSKFMTKVRNLNHFLKSLLTTAKENYNFVINPTNYPCELSTNSLIIQMDDHIVIILCGEGVGRFPNTEIWLRGENVLMFINKGSRESVTTQFRIVTGARTITCSASLMTKVNKQ
jgi:hypothetical protein